MTTIKRTYGKDTERQFIHFVQSFLPYDRLTTETAKYIKMLTLVFMQKDQDLMS
ncbi:hypothetical protein [Wukongibacter sp. M2B1]|uniref:hypothetical protein n=1 Tax=Wukongibacter sp. M2B1 TaxID=3088895 RepID=UPI003D7BD86E